MTANVSRMPGKGTTRRSVRVPDEVWDPAMAKAKERDEDLSAIIRERLVEYAEEES